MGQKFKDKLFKTITSPIHMLETAFVEAVSICRTACLQASHSQFIIRIFSIPLFPKSCLPGRSLSGVVRFEAGVASVPRLFLLLSASFPGRERPVGFSSAPCDPITYYIYGLHKFVV